LTEDKDFGELAYRLRKPSAGIVLIRIDVKDRDLKWLRLKSLIENYEQRLPGHFVVIHTNKYRFRPLIFSLSNKFTFLYSVNQLPQNLEPFILISHDQRS